MTQPEVANNDISPTKHIIILMKKPAIVKGREPIGRLPGVVAVESEAMKPSSISLAAVVLAAGRSSRMGCPKLLLPWAETSLLGHLIAQWKHLGARVIGVVCATGDIGINAELDRLQLPAAQRIMNPVPEHGMFSSVQCAATWHGWPPEVSHWAIVLGDQPHLRLETLEAIVAFTAANPGKICQPRKSGHRHHPVIMPRIVFESIRNTVATTLKEFLVSFESAYCEMNDPGLELDIDRPEDYQKALQFGKTM